MGNREIFVEHNSIKTMVDGKICNALMDNPSAQVCYICGAKPKDMYDLKKKIQSLPINKSAFEFGLSTLHARIRFFECLLHIGYRIEIKKWQVRGDQRIMRQGKKKLLTNLELKWAF